MNSRHLVDPQLLPLLEVFPNADLARESLPELRAQMSALSAPDQSGALVEEHSVGGPAGAPHVAVRVLRPKEATGPLPVIYHIHGGGYVAGSAADSDARNGPTAVALGCAVVSVDYRLAPETPFPGPVEDCYAGLAWLFAHASGLGLDPSRIGVMGESAGGGLAAALALLARDRGEYRLAFQHLIYPMLDDRTGTSSDPHPYVGDFVWTPAKNRFGWEALLGHAPGGEGVSPYASPARAEDLAGLPPTFLYTGALDLFLEENIDYARRLARAGVPIEFHLFPGAFHGFELQADSHLSQQAQLISRAALRRFLALPS